ncbi:uncharacterized protein [Diadema antillarum]|uniref:uncharacterized protein n=1 Tax=Diadema antillarum TaxID=105358 RepID=UPI003A84359E
MADEKKSRYVSMINRCTDEGRASFESLVESVSAAADEDVTTVEKDVGAQVSRAKHEAEAAIRKIMADRDQKIRDIHQKATLKNVSIRERKETLLDEIKKLRTTFESWMKDRRERVETELKRPEADPMMDAKVAEETEASLSNTLTATAKENLDAVRKLTAACRKIKFARQKDESEDLLGNLTGVKHSWELHGSVSIPPSVVYPELLTASRTENSVIMTNEMRSGLFEMNLDTQQTRAVISDTHFDICDCVSSDNDGYVVSEYNSKAIHLYDSKGTAIKSWTLPSACGRVAVSRDGLILVGDESNGKIYFLNPRNGKIIKTVPVSGKKIHGLHVLSRGWIVVQTSITTICVYDEHGAMKERIQNPDWSEVRCAAYHDVLYIMYKKTDDTTTYVATRHCGGKIENIIRCKISRSTFLLSEFLVTSSETVAINGDNEILVFTKAPGYEEMIKFLK